MTGLLQDIRFAFRMIGRAPAVAATAILSLALGIGANAVVFSWVNALVIRPLPGVPSEGLVVVDGVAKSGLDQRLSFPDYIDIRDRSEAFDGILVEAWQPLNLGAGDRSDRIWSELVSGNFFDVLRVYPVIGRTFSATEGVAPGADPVAVISHALWQRRFDGSPGVIGRSITLNGFDFIIIGVAPPEFRGATAGLAFDIWLPVTMQPQLVPGINRLDDRSVHWMGSLARLREDVTLEEAGVRLQALAQRLGEQHPPTNEGTGFAVTTLAGAPWGATNTLRPVLAVLSAVVSMVLLIACANVASVLLSRAVGRRREVAVRLALGAGRGRLIRQFLVESFVLAGIAGIVGAAAAAWSAPVLEAMIPPTSFPVSMDFTVDTVWLAFAAVVSCVTALAFGLAPALLVSGYGLAGSLKDEGVMGGSFKKSRLRQALVVAEIAVSLLLLVGAGLFVRGLQTAAGRSPGFDPDRLVLASLDLASGQYDTERGRVFYQTLAERVTAIPGVAGAAWGRRVPLNFGGRASTLVDIDGYVAQRNEEVRFDLNQIGPGYLGVMSIPLIRGREFEWRDRQGVEDVAIVNETAARRYWNGGDPIGRKLSATGRTWTVVGVARDIKYDSLDEAPKPYLYLPLMQSFSPSAVLHVRTNGDSAGLARALRRAAAGMDSSMPLFDIKPMAEHMSIATFLYRLGAALLGVFGGLALLLSSVGLYSVIAYSVAERTREMGLRMALGASGRRIGRMVVGQALVLIGIGTTIGLTASVFLGQAVTRVAAGVNPLDPFVFVIAPAVLGFIALLAAWIPARRAARLNPVEAIRHR